MRYLTWKVWVFAEYWIFDELEKGERGYNYFILDLQVLTNPITIPIAKQCLFRLSF